jgi:hypothetical protein
MRNPGEEPEVASGGDRRTVKLALPFQQGTQVDDIALELIAWHAPLQRLVLLELRMNRRRPDDRGVRGSEAAQHIGGEGFHALALLDELDRPPAQAGEMGDGFLRQIRTVMLDLPKNRGHVLAAIHALLTLDFLCLGLPGLTLSHLLAAIHVEDLSSLRVARWPA